MAELPDYSQINQALGRLSRNQLEQVRKRCTFLLQYQTREQVPVEQEDWLLLGILSELRYRGLDKGSFQLKNHSSHASFNSQSEKVRELLLEAAPGLTPVERRVLGQVAAAALAKYISWTDVNRDNMLRYVSHVPEAVDVAFPGYMESRLLHLVVGKVDGRTEHG